MLELDFFKQFLLSRRAGSLVRTIAWLSIVSVSIGVFALVVVVSVMNGFHDSIRKRLLAAEPHLVVNLPKAPAVGFGISDEAFNFVKAEGGEFDLIDRQDVVIRTSDGVFSGAEARGLEPSAIARLVRAVDEANQVEKPSSYDIPKSESDFLDMAPGEIMMGAELARGLGIFEGDRITVIAPEALLLPPGEAPRFERLTVKRLLTTNVADLDGKLFLYSRSKSLKGLGATASRRTDVEIWLKRAERARGIKGEMIARDSNLSLQTVQTWEERNSALFHALRLEIFSIGLFLSLSTMIAGFSIVTVLLILITQKRKEIGLLMSMGLSRIKTRALFTRLGMLLSSVGILSGAAMGVIVCLLIDSMDTSILPEFYYDTTIPAKLNLWFVFGVVAFAMCLAFLASYIPARRITELEPADALMSRHRNREAHL
ncbi:MAG: FtsX-like permease family protein [Bdellovibrionales bacterium]|nr:FtsX-like permease family protein [Bdellovibrionales bacterium]